MAKFILPQLLALAATVLLGQAGAQPAESALTIFTRFDHPASATSIEHMRVELDAIMSPLDVHCDLRALEPHMAPDAVTQIVVVSFRGLCQADADTPVRPPSGALGWTHITDGEILPFNEVDCDRIRYLMASPLYVAAPFERDRLLGRAMARVLAHELYHFLTRTTQHASAGIAKPFFTASELAAGTLRFEAPQIRQVSKGRQHTVTRDRRPAGPPAGGG